MSKYQDALNQSKATKEVLENIRSALGLNAEGLKDARNDKASLRLSYTAQHRESWNDASFLLHASYGFYGNSSSHSAMTKEVARYMEKGLNQVMFQAAEYAIQFALEDLRKAKQAAQEEAQTILGELENV